MREDAVREADTCSRAERLHDQRDRIMRRLERHDHPAEVVAFPHRTRQPPGRARLLGPARRWIAGAAAAGLAAGMFLGFAMDRRMHYAAINQAIQQSTAPPRPRSGRSRRATISSSSKSTTRWSARAFARCGPSWAPSTSMTTPVEIREVSYFE